MELPNLVRTWLYLDHILDWYDDFNRVRNTFFERNGVFDGLVPASTGIGCANPHGSALVAKGLAVLPKQPPPPRAVPSPLQCPANDYQSDVCRNDLLFELELDAAR